MSHPLCGIDLIHNILTLAYWATAIIDVRPGFFRLRLDCRKLLTCCRCIQPVSPRYVRAGNQMCRSA
jgi:hypothetical protein